MRNVLEALGHAIKLSFKVISSEDLLILPDLQYKFYVDGEWKHDEHQPYEMSEYGIVNTVFWATEPNCVPRSPAGSHPPLPLSNMDIDNEVFQRLVRVGAL